MLRDFLRAAVDDLGLSYGSMAHRKAFEVLGISLAEKGLERAGIGAAWPQAGARVDIEMQMRPLQASGPGEVGVEFTLEGPEADDDQMRDALMAVAEKNGQERLLLDPVAQLPEADLRQLMADIEALVGDDDVSCLLGAAAVLVIWGHMEKLNADTSQIVLSGLTVGDEAIAEGMEVVLTGRRVALDRSISPEDSTGRADQVSKVRVPKH